MIQRLFFDGINLNRSGRSVAEAVKFSAFVDADETEAGLARADVAVARAEEAVQLAVRVWLPPAGLVELRGFLEDAQVLHGRARDAASVKNIYVILYTCDAKRTHRRGAEVRRGRAGGRRFCCVAGRRAADQVEILRRSWSDRLRMTTSDLVADKRTRLCAARTRNQRCRGTPRGAKRTHRRGAEDTEENTSATSTAAMDSVAKRIWMLLRAGLVHPIRLFAQAAAKDNLRWRFGRKRWRYETRFCRSSITKWPA